MPHAPDRVREGNAQGGLAQGDLRTYYQADSLFTGLGPTLKRQDRRPPSFMLVRGR